MNEKYPTEMAVTDKMPTPRERLNQRKASLERQLVEINAAITLLDENPAFEKCFTALQKVL